MVNIFKQRLCVQSDLWERLNWMEMREKGHKMWGMLANSSLRIKIDEESMVRRQSQDRQRTPQVPLEKLFWRCANTSPLIGQKPPCPLLSLVRLVPVPLGCYYATKHDWSRTILRWPVMILGKSRPFWSEAKTGPHCLVPLLLLHNTRLHNTMLQCYTIQCQPNTLFHFSNRGFSPLAWGEVFWTRNP